MLPEEKVNKMTIKQTLVAPYTEQKLTKLTEKNIERGCLEYRVKRNKEVCTLALNDMRTEFVFSLEEEGPVLPIKTFSEFLVRGWDIPVKYAIDNNNQCWMDNGHGGDLDKCDSEFLLREVEDEEIRNSIRKHLDMPQSQKCICCNGKGWINE